MTFSGRAQSRATEASAAALISYRSEARRDGVVTPTEAEIECLLEQSYLLNEEQDLADALAEQLKRCPESAPNVHLLRRIRDVERAWKERKKGSEAGYDDLEPAA